jgi:hypothetical protein
VVAVWEAAQSWDGAAGATSFTRATALKLRWAGCSLP